jgi:xylan 1,4-beta-xylosidase
MRNDLFRSRGLLCLVLAVASVSSVAVAQDGTSPIIINANGPATPFPHFWEKMFGSGRAILSLRDSYRRDLRNVHQITDFEYVRFHAIFHDEVGIYDEDAQGKPVYNFSYVDQIYDGLLENGVRPFVELSFTPKKLAGPNPVFHAFWYKQITSPPVDMAKWDDLIYQFTKHLVERYGEDEVAKWYFEVWNEPNIDFWAGEPKQASYFELYDHTARAVKRVSPKLRVGGPATAQAAWADKMIEHSVSANVPLDFISTHVYGNDTADNVFKTNEQIPRDRMVCRAVKKVHEEIKASARPELPLIWSEFNASYMNEVPVTDSTYMGPWMADTIRQCDGMVDILAYWSFSDVFEEQGVVKQPFYGGFGLIAADGIPKASYSAFRLLHRLGDQRLASDSTNALITKRKDGTLEIAAWNLVAPGETGPAKTVLFELKGKRAKRAFVSRVDADHGDTLSAYQKMGSPKYPTKQQVEQLQKIAVEGKPEEVSIADGKFSVTIPSSGLALIEIR